MSVIGSPVAIAPVLTRGPVATAPGTDPIQVRFQQKTRHSGVRRTGRLCSASVIRISKEMGSLMFTRDRNRVSDFVIRSGKVRNQSFNKITSPLSARK